MSESPCAAAPVVEFWFEFGSNYSYPSVMRIEAAAARHGVKVAWKPFMLGPIFHELGMDNSPFVLQKEKGAYMWQDIARECRKYGLPWTRPSSFPRLGVLPLPAPNCWPGRARTRSRRASATRPPRPAPGASSARPPSSSATRCSGATTASTTPWPAPRRRG